MKEPKLRFPEFQSKPTKLKLVEDCFFFSGGTPLTSNTKYFKGNIPFIRSGEISKNKTAQFITQDGLDNSSAKIVQKGDLLYALYGATSGAVAISKINGAINQAVLCIRPKTLNTNYLFYLLLRDKSQILQTYLQGGQGNLSSQIVKSFEFSFPSTKEQEKIVDFMQKADNRIEFLNEKKELFEKYKSGVMKKLFSKELMFKDDNGNDFPAWEEIKIGKLVKIYDGTHQTPTYVSEGIPFYSVEHVTADNFSKTKFITKEVFDKENLRVKLEKGDILMTRIGDIGTSKLINWDANASFYVSLALLKCSEHIDSAYLNQFIKSPFFQKELWERTIHVAFPKKINLGEISECRIKLPVLKEQKKIASLLEKIDEKIALVKSEIKSTKLWKKELLQEMFA
ncbi:restriction endonuclease subunit S [Kaistella jeonii]|uniref:restriction endonuclease subunit S n=1 Tax=Kaistella jeonii TaxID=266749 RepID=UPI00068DCCF4|nr:restriction endonuclease subunit S [Kaistella jeonii]SFB81306.1 type I restriction enzyme, S subunit [Kaistella jeonii]VEI96155.1 EcoKI restriction-modification system protein HsdS [Kaistella jeonii]